MPKGIKGFQKGYKCSDKTRKKMSSAKIKRGTKPPSRKGITGLVKYVKNIVKQKKSSVITLSHIE